MVARAGQTTGAVSLGCLTQLGVVDVRFVDAGAIAALRRTSRHADRLASSAKTATFLVSFPFMSVTYVAGPL